MKKFYHTDLQSGLKALSANLIVTKTALCCPSALAGILIVTAALRTLRTKSTWSILCLFFFIFYCVFHTGLNSELTTEVKLAPIFHVIVLHRGLTNRLCKAQRFLFQSSVKIVRFVFKNRPLLDRFLAL